MTNLSWSKLIKKIKYYNMLTKYFVKKGYFFYNFYNFAAPRPL